MTIVDTHVAIWMVSAPERLSRPALRRLREAPTTGGLGIASVSLFEIALLVTRGRLRVQSPLETLLEEICQHFAVRSISARIAAAAARFTDPYPRDPIDRIIGATAIAERVPLVTANEPIRRSGQVQTIW